MQDLALATYDFVNQEGQSLFQKPKLIGNINFAVKTESPSKMSFKQVDGESLLNKETLRQKMN